MFPQYHRTFISSNRYNNNRYHHHFYAISWLDFLNFQHKSADLFFFFQNIRQNDKVILYISSTWAAFFFFWVAFFQQIRVKKIWLSPMCSQSNSQCFKVVLSFSPIDIAGPTQRHSNFLYKIYLSLRACKVSFIFSIGKAQSLPKNNKNNKKLRCNPIKLIQRWINNYPRKNPEKRAWFQLEEKPQELASQGRTIMDIINLSVKSGD